MDFDRLLDNGLTWPEAFLLSVIVIAIAVVLVGWPGRRRDDDD